MEVFMRDHKTANLVSEGGIDCTTSGQQSSLGGDLDGAAILDLSECRVSWEFSFVFFCV